MSPDPPEAELFNVVPDQFVAARDALAKRLRAEGDKAEAARVAKLRRPPFTAWALNQAARDDPALLDRLFHAGDELRRAMETALAGDAGALRPARAEERSAVDSVVNEASRRLAEAGHPATDAMQQRMASTLRAAIVDESVAASLRQGVLDADHEAPGFGLEGLSLPAGQGKGAAEDADQPEVEKTAERAAHKRSDDAAKQAEDRARRAAEAAQLGAEAQRLEAEADRLAAEADRLAAEALEARKRATDARARANRADGEG